jgi:ABC-type dipeptide/oligopeptide/nickel transport system permease subunit
MLTYIARRIVLAIFTVWAVSVLAFVIIQLPPGDYITSYIAQMAATGSIVTEQMEAEKAMFLLGTDVQGRDLWSRLLYATRISLTIGLVGCSQMRILFVHMVPSFMSHIIAATTLALPAMIISETALSFLGLGLRPLAISWGVLLQQAQNVQTVAISP